METYERVFGVEGEAGTASRQPAGRRRYVLVAEVADSGEEHGEAETVGGCDDFGIAL
jgi:hypothetical protein